MPLNPHPGIGYTLDGATTTTKTKDTTLRALLQNFERHYATNRAPFALHIHLKWLETIDNRVALQLFLDATLPRDNVWFVTNTEAIEWIKTGKMFECVAKKLQPHEIVCDVANVCRIDGLLEPFFTCAECPKKYPWFRNEFGNVFY